jgi:hypothetical protein
MSKPDASVSFNGGVIPGRSCGSCTLCCKLLEIEALEKPRNHWCAHCEIGSGCKAYDARPSECRDFYCGFLTLPHLDAAWHPSVSKLIVCLEQGGHTIFVHVEPSRPNAWRAEPYYSRLKRWAHDAARCRGQVIVSLAKRRIVVLPDRDVDLGIVENDEVVVTEECCGLRGINLRPFKMKRSDPRAQKLLPSSSRPAMPTT